MTYLNKTFISIQIFLIFTLILSACAGQVTRSMPSKYSKGSPYKLRPGDILEITLIFYPEFDQTVVVHEDGRISLRALGKLKVINMTREALTALLYERYAELLAKPNVEIKIQESTEFKIFFGGDLVFPGMVNFREDLSIVQGILLAGGLKDKSNEYKVTIFRNRMGRRMKTFNFVLKKNGKQNRSIQQFKLAPYDVVIILKSPLSKQKKGRQI
ncbi:MAG: polysaccharide biosynthesis/export family protein [bacterium]